ncbi:MAG: twin-arginine translocase TatA/TatE family subunit, partial [Microcystis aeruginosa]
EFGAALGKTLRGFKEEINQDEQEIEDSDEKMR